jgi:DeoR family suf operon transcriptional repressor
MQAGLTNCSADHRMGRNERGLVTTSRRRIVLQLKKSGEASVTDLSRALGLTSVTVRHHLQDLRRDGLVDDPTPRRRKGPGRPEMAYHLVPEAPVELPRNYDELCECLADQLSRRIPSEALMEMLACAGEELSRSSGPERPGRNRAELTEAFLEQRGYFPRWGEAGDGLKLHLTNCPYREIAQRLPEMCWFDKALVAGLMGTNVKMEASIAGGAAACCFLLAGEPAD